MKSFQLAFFVSLIAVLCVALAGSPRIGAEQKEGREVCFHWAFGAIPAEGDSKLVSITRDMMLKTGDSFKMFVELQKKCFVYLIYYSAQGEVEMLFPYSIQQITDDYRILKKYYIPQGDMWFEMNGNVGRETFYLLASAQRLIPLEELISAYESEDTSKKPELAKKVLSEIRKIKRLNRKLTASAERPVPIGGNVRGINKEKKLPFPDISIIAVEISATSFYSRTFTIDHQ